MTIALYLLSAAAVLFIFIMVRFLRWKKQTIEYLNKHSHVIETEKGPIEYQIYGDKGEYALFLHGAPGGYDQFAKHRSEYFKRFRVISISRFGYLRTPLSTAMTLPDQADAVAALLDALKINKVVVNAGSGGGPLALAFSAFHPNRVNRLVLYAVGSQAINLSDDRPGVKILKMITRSDFLCWLLLVRLIQKPEKMVKMLVKNEKNSAAIIESGQAKQFAQGITVMFPPSLRNPGMDNDLRILKALDIPKEKITAPTLILHGDKDEHVPYEQSVLLQKQIKNAALITVKGADHFMGYTHSDFIEQAYKDFFEGLDQKQPADSPAG